MKTVIIIPARYASTRYPGKPLVELTLPDGARKSLIQLSWEAACRVTGVDGVYVATDDVRIRDASNAFPGMACRCIWCDVGCNCVTAAGIQRGR